jgi:hypothetical protein
MSQYGSHQKAIVYYLTYNFMIYALLFIFIELMIIISLSLIIKGYMRERDVLIGEMKEIYKTIESKTSARTQYLVQQAHSISLKLPSELYKNSFKRNIIVKETCNRFYELLTKINN